MPVAPTTEPEAAVPAEPNRSLWKTLLTPRWLGLLALALAIAAVMSVLGVWQLDVYRSKTAAKTAERTAAAPVALQSLFPIDAGLPSKAVGRRVTVTGTWGPATDQLYISDRRLGDRNGFWVVTPVLLDTSGSGAGDGGTTNPSGAVMVVRGWVPSATDPAAKPPTGQVQLVGAIVASEAQDASGDDTEGRILQSLRIPTIVHLVDYRIYDAFVVMSSSTPAPATLAPTVVPPPAPPTDHAGLRNVAYAFQWWIFAAFTLWMWTRMLQDAHRTPTRPESPPTPA
ncbi:cytochrome oxidase assembly protein ShyY1 [Kribbella voronezhensis]|uniref:SURF1-like protein n=1 Tax=Kribbella voronezhensis TaxID=2512212 RepID=A0A4R7TCR3_9ACTN|nr:SURF1 family protein [Kribbella voronezhensis]TDU89874.1 cytochrome oxidase assembly protein ShyY1 [Kribbella voronezhensis]